MKKRDVHAEQSDPKPDAPKPMDDASNSRESNKTDNKTARQNDRGN